MSLNDFPDKVICVASYHTGNPDTLVRTTLVCTDTTVTKGHKILVSREWWNKDYEEDDILNEVDELIGELKGPRSVVLHVQGVVPLTKTNGLYNSSLVTRSDLLNLMRDSDKFRGC